jgi:tetraacyldisaccharide 4'-kinase
MKLLAPKFWQKKNLISFLLYPFSILYSLITSVVSYIPTSNIYIPRAKVIRVGNITMGGAGKTPVVIALAKLFSGRKVAILTRGYKGGLYGPIILNSNHKIVDVGDEALLLGKIAPTCIAKNRLEGIKYLEALGFEIIITDDGMQDNKFKAAFTIMVIDSYFGLGNNMIFPSGPLRESLKSGLKKADMVVLVGDGEFEGDFPVVRASLVSEVVLNNRKFTAFAGIGNPEKFFNSVEKAGGTVVIKRYFPDHYQYNNQDMQELFSLGYPLITTEKDWVRLNKEYQASIEFLPVNLVWQDRSTEQKLLNL